MHSSTYLRLVGDIIRLLLRETRTLLAPALPSVIGYSPTQQSVNFRYIDSRCTRTIAEALLMHPTFFVFPRPSPFCLKVLLSLYKQPCTQAPEHWRLYTLLLYSARCSSPHQSWHSTTVTTSTVGMQ